MRVHSDVYLPQGSRAYSSGLLLLACAFPPGITVLSQGAAGIGTGSGNLFGHAIITAGTLLSAVISQCYSAASQTQWSLQDPAGVKAASVGPETLGQQLYPDIGQAVLVALMAVFGFLGDPIKAWREGKGCGGKPVCLLQLFPQLDTAPRLGPASPLQAVLCTDVAPSHVVNPSEGDFDYP